MNEPSPPWVLEGLQRADPAAFDWVYEAYRSKVFSFLVRLTRLRSLAEDLTQETFLRLARTAPRLNESSNLRAWLFRVARNLAIDHQRWALLDFDSLFELSLIPRAQTAAHDPLDMTLASEMQARVESALASLSVEHREVLLLVSLEGLTPSEAAVVLDVSDVALRKRLSRARSQLASRLEVSASNTMPHAEITTKGELS